VVLFAVVFVVPNRISTIREHYSFMDIFYIIIAPGVLHLTQAESQTVFYNMCKAFAETWLAFSKIC
jgi:hypothetical protein